MMVISADKAMEALAGMAVPGKDADMAAYHKIERRYLGVSNPDIDAACKSWRTEITPQDRQDLARDLWATNVHEARVAAAKLLTQARIRPGDAWAWDLIKTWVPDFDAWAIADHVAIAGQKRLIADPQRISGLSEWVTSPHMWTRRAALVMTLPWARMRNPKPDELAIREQVLSWAATYVPDREWYMQKVVAWWLRDLSKKDPARVREFLGGHGAQMKPFARREASRYLDPST